MPLLLCSNHSLNQCGLGPSSSDHVFKVTSCIRCLLPPQTVPKTLDTQHDTCERCGNAGDAATNPAQQGPTESKLALAQWCSSVLFIAGITLLQRQASHQQEPWTWLQPCFQSESPGGRVPLRNADPPPTPGAQGRGEGGVGHPCSLAALRNVPEALLADLVVKQPHALRALEESLMPEL